MEIESTLIDLQSKIWRSELDNALLSEVRELALPRSQLREYAEILVRLSQFRFEITMKVQAAMRGILS